MKRYSPALIIFLLFYTISLSAQGVIDYGLHFLSHKVNKDLRTGFAISPLTDVKQGFSFSFQLHLVEKNPKFGYIFRLVLNDQESIDFISNSHARPGHTLTVVERDEPASIFFDLPPRPDAAHKSWLNVMVVLDPAAKTIAITIDGKTLSGSFHQTSLSTVRLFFGSNAFGKFSTSDVPPMELRDLKILDHKQVLLKHWAFKEHQGSVLYDMADNEKLLVNNPIWLIDAHTRWKKKTSFITAAHPQLSFRDDSATVLAATTDSLYAYTLYKNALKKIRYASGAIFPVANNQMIFHPLFRELWQYDVQKGYIAQYDFETNTWSNSDRQSKEPAFWHHNKFISPLDSTLLVFGGYGNFRYKNLVQQFNNRLQRWDSVPVQGSIKPRYLSAAGRGFNPLEVLIFGGYGNASGRQELSPEKLYDLHSFDLHNHTFKKLWEKEGLEEDFVVANSLVANTGDSSFYILCYPIHKYASLLYLRQCFRAAPDNIIVGDTIPYLFQDTKSYCDLFYSSGTNELVAVTSCPVSDSLSEVSVYTIAYPAITRQAAMQFPAISAAREKYTWLYLLVCIVLIPGLLFVLYRKRKKQKPAAFPPLPPVAATVTEDDILPIIGATMPAPSALTEPAVRNQPGIYLAGGLQVINQEGADITASFTPALRQLLILLTFYTAKTRKGISSVQLKNILWPDKSEDSARNNRGVHINKIRSLLSELGEAAILNDSNHWSLSLDNSIACDYFSMGKLMDNVHQSTLQEDHELIALASRGGLLPDMEYEWLDSFKSAYASKMIDSMLVLAEKPATRKDPATLIAISEVIFLQDPLNETALAIKCRELLRLGKHTVAKSTYRSFVHEYATTMGTDFTRKFEEIIRG